MNVNYSDLERYIHSVESKKGEDAIDPLTGNIDDSIINEYFTKKFGDKWTSIKDEWKQDHIIKTTMTGLQNHLAERAKMKPGDKPKYSAGTLMMPEVKKTSGSTKVSSQVKDTKRSGAVTTAADKTTSGFAKHDDAKAEAVRKQQEAAKVADATKQQSDSSKEISTSIVNSGNAQLGALDRIAGLLERQIVATEGVGAKTKKQADEAGINAVAVSQKATEAMVSPLRPKPQPKQPKPPAINVNKTVLANA